MNELARPATQASGAQIKNIDLAKEALRIIEAGSSRGRNTQVEVLDARAALTKATGMYYKAVHAHGMARLGLLSATGAIEPGEALGRLAGAVANEAPAIQAPAEDGDAAK